jgi:hypothetical protein
VEDATLTDPELVDQTATTTAAIHGTVPVTDLVSFFDRSLAELAAVLDEQGITPTGPAFARYAGPPCEIAGQGLTPVPHANWSHSNKREPQTGFRATSGGCTKQARQQWRGCEQSNGAVPPPLPPRWAPVHHG